MENNNKKNETNPGIQLAKLAPKSTFGKALAFISDKFLKPSVITVFVTALLGPLAIQWVNESIENKKLQEKVISTVLNYTSEADFSKPESIEKIGIIAQMVDENQEVFGLSFQKTNNKIDELNEATNNVGIKNLDKKLKEAKANIKDFSQKLAGDSVVLKNLILEKEKLNEQLERYKKNKNTKKAKLTEEQVAKLNLDFRDLEKTRQFNRERLKYWTEQKETIEQDINDATKDLANVLKKKRDKETMLKQEKEALKTELAKTLSDINLMESRIKELENSNQILKDSINVLKITNE